MGLGARSSDGVGLRSGGCLEARLLRREVSIVCDA